ncbi:MAG: TRAP transporter small permease [Pseudomonadota bacterium]
MAVFATSCLFILLNVLNRYLVLGMIRDLTKDWAGLRPAYFWVRDLLGSVVVTADEVPGFPLVWIAFLGAYLAMRREGHIDFDLLAEALPARARRALAIVNAALIGGFLLMLFWQSARMICVSGATEIETAEIAEGWFMLIMPLAAVQLLTAAGLRLRKRLAADPSPGTPDHGLARHRSSARHDRHGHADRLCPLDRG